MRKALRIGFWTLGYGFIMAFSYIFGFEGAKLLVKLDEKWFG